MQGSLRKLVGSVALLALVVIYALVATAIATARLADSPGWVHFLYFLLTGFLWVVPAMGIVSWMLRPDRSRKSADV